MGRLSCVIITVSDTCSAGESQDTSGPYLVEAVKKAFTNADITLHVVSDDMDRIENALMNFSDVTKTDLIITTGGTGFTKRDVTPEATRKVIDKEAPGISTAICVKSLLVTEMAMLSRGVCGVRKDSLIINFPGSLKAVKECFSIVERVLPHALDQIRGNTLNIKADHTKIQVTVENPQEKRFEYICPHKNSSGPVSQVAFRERNSNYPMIEVAEASRLIQELDERFSPSVEIVPLNECLYRTVAGTVSAREPYPPFPASTKDGYACRCEDGIGVRSVREAVMAGDEGGCPLGPGECSRISTGAPVPPGADCVVQVEDTKLLEHSDDGSVEFKIEVMVQPSVGQDIRQIGSDIRIKEEILTKGTVIGPAEKALLCTLGLTNVTVFSKVKIGILSTGNELQNPDEIHLKPGHIRDSNKSMLMALLGEYAECEDLGIATDDIETLIKALKRGFTNCRVIVTTGGVSMGERDLLKEVIVKHFNGNIIFGRVNMKPGKPTVFADCVCYGERKTVFALPGNPASAYVASHLFVIPALKRLSKRRQYDWPKINVVLDDTISLDVRPEYARATFTLHEGKALPVATLTGNQISSRITSAVNAPLLVLLPSSLRSGPTLPKDTVVTAMIIGKF